MATHNIGSFIIACRKKKEMTRKELADQLGVKEQLVKKWETNLVFPKGNVLSSLCDCLDIRVEELILGEHLEQEELLEKSEQIILELYHKKSDDAFLTYKMIWFFILLPVAVFLFVSIQTNSFINDCINMLFIFTPFIIIYGLIKIISCLLQHQDYFRYFVLTSWSLFILVFYLLQRGL